MSGVGAYFDPAYFEWQAARAEVSARTIVPMLLELVPARSAVDLGCGTGAWLQVLSQLGVEDVVGVDGGYIDRAQLRIPAERFVAADLAEPPSLDRGFDLALSLEAAHYAPDAAAATIVRWLTACAPAVYFSAAVPHQPGGPGLNRQWPAYWSELFEQEGFRCHDAVRPQLWERPDADWWYAQNGLLYVREGAALRDAAPPGRPLPLVHPELLALVAETAAPAPEPVAATPRRRVFGVRRRG
jgi:SAM-dependent methyltransferase